MHPAKIRRLVIIASLTLGLPLSILAAQFAGAVLPFIPAAIVATIACGTHGALLIFHVSKLIGV